MRQIERCVRLGELKEDIIRRINEAKERGDQTGAGALEDELFEVEMKEEELERELSPTHSRLADE